MIEIETADGCRRPHCVALGELDADVVLGIEQLEQKSLLRMVGSSRVAGCWPDAPIALAKQVVFGQLLVMSEPAVSSSLFVGLFGQSLGEPVRQGFHENGVVIVVVALVSPGELVDPQPRRYNKGP